MTDRFGKYLVSYFADGEIRTIQNTITNVFILSERSLFFAWEKLSVLENLARGGVDCPICESDVLRDRCTNPVLH